MRAECKAIAQVGLLRISIGGLEIDGELDRLIVRLDERNIRVIVLEFRQNYFVTIGLGEGKDMWE